MAWEDNMIHVYEREESRCAREAAEDAGEFDDYYAEREAAKREWVWDESEFDEGADE